MKLGRNYSGKTRHASADSGTPRTSQAARAPKPLRIMALGAAALVAAALLVIACSWGQGSQALANQAAQSAGQSWENANSWRYINGQRRTDVAQEMEEWVYSKEHGIYLATDFDQFSAGYYTGTSAACGADISHWNGEIDWDKMVDAGIQFVIISCGYGDDDALQDDTNFVQNYTNAKAAGIKVGVYLYSYATNITGEASAASEAAHVLRILAKNNIQPSDLDLPIYYDMEDNSTIGSDLTGIATTFFNAISAAGYQPGIYASKSWLENYLTAPIFSTVPQWCAQWNSANEGLTYHAFSDFANSCGIWQFTDMGDGEHFGVGNDFLDLNYSFYEVGEFRVFGSTALDTMAAASQLGFADGSCKSLVIATADGYWDALSANGLAGRFNAPVLMTSGASLSSQTRAEIERLAADEGAMVYLMGGTAALSEHVEQQISAMSCVKGIMRIAGDDSVRTSVQAALWGGSWGDTCIVATTGGYWDGLAASPYAYAQHAPIFLVAAGATSLDMQVRVAIENFGFSRVIVAGGPAAVSDEVCDELEGITGNVVRCYGNSAVDTAVELAKLCVEAGMDVNHVGVATTNSYYDALTGASLCASKNSPLVLVNSSQADIAANWLGDFDTLEHPYIFGGQAAIDHATYLKIAQLAN